MSGEAVEPLTLRTPAARESHRAGALVVLLRLRWFIRLRWLFAAVALGVLGVERLVLPATQRPWELLTVVLGVAAMNVVWIITSRLLRRWLNAGEATEHVAVRSARVFANAQVATDLLLLTGILHYTGGVENPMSVFYLFHVAIGALLLKTWHSLVQSCWAVVLFAAMMIAEWRGVLEHYALLPQLGSVGLYDHRDYALLVVAVQACAVFGTLYFTLRIAKLLDSHEAQLRRANAALEQSRRAIQDLQHRRARFMQTAAHQLKSPLAIVQTLANLIRDGIVTDRAGIQATCEKIARRSQEGIGQVGELLTLARVQDADRARHRKSRVDVREAVLQLCRHFKPLAERRQLELSCWTPADGDLSVSVDPQDFKDCIGNLIDNAIKYTPGPGRVRVVVTAKRCTGRPVSIGIHVSDTGMGFDPELLRSDGNTLGHEPVFDAFRRGSNVIAAGIPGTGLGLSIVREVVEQAGGRLWVMSRPGVGSSFTVTLPASGAAEDQPLVRDTRATEVVLEASGGDSTSDGKPSRGQDRA